MSCGQIKSANGVAVARRGGGQPWRGGVGGVTSAGRRRWRIKAVQKTDVVHFRRRDMIHVVYVHICCFGRFNQDWSGGYPTLSQLLGFCLIVRQGAIRPRPEFCQFASLKTSAWHHNDVGRRQRRLSHLTWSEHFIDASIIKVGRRIIQLFH